MLKEALCVLWIAAANQGQRGLLWPRGRRLRTPARWRRRRPTATLLSTMTRMSTQSQSTGPPPRAWRSWTPAPEQSRHSDYIATASCFRYTIPTRTHARTPTPMYLPTQPTGPYVRSGCRRTHLHVEVDDPVGETETVIEIGRVARWTRTRE